MTREEYILLYEKYLSGKSSHEEQKSLESYLDELAPDEEWDPVRMGDQETVKQSILNELSTSIQKSHRIIRLRKWSVAATITIILFTAGLYMFSNKDPELAIKPKPSHFKNDILPGNNKAVLTLDDGSSINLDDAKIGILARQSNTNIKKVIGGQLEYRVTAGSEASTIKYNTLITPLGGQYSIVLPDGSKVWLNAGSSLRFPTSFGVSERRVELKGEAYFEIAKNESIPFKVIANDMEVLVTGTHFNVMAYDNENNINTTLLEGSVHLVKGTEKAYLVPGQEAVLNKSTGTMTVSPADLEQAIAWKNGYFIFSNENIESIMRKVSRWYNVDVSYQGNLSNKDFVGTIPRNKNVSELLKMLELTGAVHFSIEGRRIIVMP